MSEHTKTPWTFKVETITDLSPFAVIEASEQYICQTVHGNDVANAEFIIKAVNNHDKLVESLNLMTELVSIAQNKYGSAKDPVGVEVKKAKALLEKLK